MKTPFGNPASSISSAIIIADNGSSDGSIKIAKKLGATVINVKNKGYGNVLRAGIKKSRGNIICESACGVNLRCTEVVRLDTPLDKVYNRTEKREGKLDEEYISLLESCMIPSKYTVKDTESLERILDKLFEINPE